MPKSMNTTSSSISNNTNESLQLCELFPEPKESFRFRVIVLFALMLMSIVGNGLVCYGATRRRKRPFSYYLVTNLAVAELIYTTLHPFHFLYNTKPYSWIFGDFMCHVVDPLTLCTTLVVAFNLATIAVYRCIMMLQPYRYRPSTRFAYIVITMSWISAVVLSLPDSVTRQLFKYEGCDVFLCINAVDLSNYRMTIFILNFVVPFITMVLSYSSVICRVRKHFLKTKQESIQLKSNENLVTRSSAAPSDSKLRSQTRDKEGNKSSEDGQSLFKDPQPRNRPTSNKMMRLEADVLNMIYLIILLFILCYLPSNVLFILTEGLGLYSLKTWHYYWLMIWYLDLLHMVPSALHPICYGANSLILGQSLKLPFCKIKRKT